jgi:hypothetical protein
VSIELTNEFSEYDALTLNELITAMDAVQKQKEVLEDQLKAVNKRFDFLRISKIPTKMDDEGVSNINITGVGRVSLTADMHVSIKTEMKESFYVWLRDNGRGDLLQETINPSTLKATVKGMFKGGQEIPEDLLNVSPFMRASITRK